MQDKLKGLIEKFKLPFFSGLSVLALILFSVFSAELLYNPKEMIKRGYRVEFSKSGKVIKKEKKEVDIAVLMKKADASEGKKIFRKCASCHNIEKGLGHKIGPNLFGVVGKKKGVASGFTYSKAMKEKGGKWNIEALNKFLKKPRDYVLGTKMGFSGLRKGEDRANVIKYLESKR